MKIEKGVIALLLVGLEVLLILSSWIVGAAMPDANVRSLLGNEGIRWFFGYFTDNLQTPLLVWVVLLSTAYGAFVGSGLLRMLSVLITGKESFRSLHYRQRMGLRIVLAEMLLMACVIGLLAFVPHAMLLSITGGLFPSSFSMSIVPIVSFAAIVCSLSYGLSCGRVRGIADTYELLTVGVKRSASLFPLYILSVQLYYSFLFVFM
ncbi:hypothetical protein [Prevotella dentasini]|uniref:hypothetical protein n=1 Tax=Prevotella dentasini TaxID=589537 RepID=UPI000468C746|nr:hypothetical protein [Prevotella dentasini]